MARRRLLGLGSGEVDRGTKEIRFTLTVKDCSSKSFEMDLGAASQIIGALGRMYQTAQELAHASNEMFQGTAEKVASANVHQELWTGKVVLQLTTPAGIPYTFVMPAQDAAEIAARLKTESAKPHQSGKA